MIIFSFVASNSARFRLLTAAGDGRVVLKVSNETKNVHNDIETDAIYFAVIIYLPLQ